MAKEADASLHFSQYIFFLCAPATFFFFFFLGGGGGAPVSTNSPYCWRRTGAEVTGIDAGEDARRWPRLRLRTSGLAVNSPVADQPGLCGRGGGRLRRGRLHGVARARAGPGRDRRGLRPARSAQRRCRLRHPEQNPGVGFSSRSWGPRFCCASSSAAPTLPALRHAGRAAALGGGRRAQGARPDGLHYNPFTAATPSAATPT